MLRPLWVAAGLSAGVLCLSGAEFIGQWRSLGGASMALVASLPMLIKSGSAGVGAYLVWRGWPRRMGRGLFCRRCGYHQEERGRIVAECPECGAPWRWIGRSRSGEWRGRSWMVSAGALLLVLVAGSWMVRQGAPWVVLRWTPTDVLIQQLGMYPDDELNDHWSEFDNRTIPAEKLRELAEALVQKKTRDGYLSKRAEGMVFVWMSRSSTTPTPAAKQYFSRVVSAVMKAPEAVEVGDTVTLRTQARFDGGIIVARPEPRVVVLSAVYIDGAEEAAEWWVWPVRAIPEVQTRTLTHAAGAPRVGQLEVRQVFWLAIGGTGEGEAWVGSKGPVLPDGMKVFDHFELARTIVVKEVKPGR